MLKIHNPFTGKIIREMEMDTPPAIAAAYEKARRGQRQWAATVFKEREQIIRVFRNSLEQNVEQLARTLTSEMGKPKQQAKDEILGTCQRIDFFLEQTASELKMKEVYRKAQATERISYDPLGVVANISAWNYPYFVGSNVFVPALLTGNAVLYKPSEFATLTGLAIADLLYAAGVPQDVFVLVIGTGAVGAELLRQRLDGVFFTGSYATGRKIAIEAAKHLMKIQLELGGKDPTYVCDDVEAKSVAASLADGAFYNAGQSCCAVERIYVHAKVYDAFLAAFVDTVRGFRMGDPCDESTYIGPLTRAAQLSVLEEQVNDAVAQGAEILVGGRRVDGPGNFFEPTVLAGVSHKMLVMREESFGPVIGIQKVDGDEQALELMRDTKFGLTAGVYSADRERAERILREVDSGSAYVNCCDRVSPRLPWSGRGNSGIGVTLSLHGIQAFLKPRAWHVEG